MKRGFITSGYGRERLYIGYARGVVGYATPRVDGDRLSWLGGQVNAIRVSVEKSNRLTARYGGTWRPTTEKL